MEKVYRKRVEGSYTVEAALIFPFILYIIIALIYLGFYLHDYGKMQAIIHEGQIRGKGLVINETDMNTGVLSYDNYLKRTVFYPVDNDFESKEKKIKNFIYSKGHDNLLAAKIIDIDVEVRDSSTTIIVKMKIKFPIRILESFFLGSENMIIKSEEQNTQPTDFIRIYQVSVDIGEKIDFVNQIINKLKKAVNILK
ncbi:MAG TPA: hypothetical protein GX705_02630 [Clostridiales bacterium]|nr:hypothetical protein [Clostridiales bacterium]